LSLKTINFDLKRSEGAETDPQSLSWLEQTIVDMRNICIVATSVNFAIITLKQFAGALESGVQLIHRRQTVSEVYILKCKQSVAQPISGRVTVGATEKTRVFQIWPLLYQNSHHHTSLSHPHLLLVVVEAGFGNSRASAQIV
jgi:hypothetical protein